MNKGRAPQRGSSFMYWKAWTHIGVSKAWLYFYNMHTCTRFCLFTLSKVKEVNKSFLTFKTRVSRHVTELERIKYTLLSTTIRFVEEKRWRQIISSRQNRIYLLGIRFNKNVSPCGFWFFFFQLFFLFCFTLCNFTWSDLSCLIIFFVFILG